MADQVTVVIDEKEIRAELGTNLVKAARENGIFIPSLCYHDHIVPPLGTCRVCMCSIDGWQTPACMERVREGLVVEVDTEELQDTRKAVVEMMFAEGNHICPACPKSGDCDLQHMAYEMGMTDIRFPLLFQDRYIDFGPQRMVIEHNRCVKCMRCVEEVVTDDGQRVFSFQSRGNETVVGIDYEQEGRLTEEQAAAAMRLCPTGAILVRGPQGWPKPFGFRKFDLESVQAPTASAPAPTPATAATHEKKTIASISLAGCFGCHMSALDRDLGLLDRIDLVEFNKSPLNDIKEFTKRCDLGLIEGGCCNAENVEVLREFRENCDILVCLGECAIWGGVPALRNTIPLAECLEETYLHGDSVEEGQGVVPYDENLPKLLDRVYACNEIVEIDHYIPGCPPNPDIIWKTVLNILWDEGHDILYSEFKKD